MVYDYFLLLRFCHIFEREKKKHADRIIAFTIMQVRHGITISRRNYNNIIFNDSNLIYYAKTQRI